VTASLATAAALRAFGSAAAVALTPGIISEAGISGLSVALVTLLLATMVVTPGLAPQSVEPAPNRPGRPPRLEVVPRFGWGACVLVGG
jgi:hypothetical protein